MAVNYAKVTKMIKKRCRIVGTHCVFRDLKIQDEKKTLLVFIVACLGTLLWSIPDVVFYSRSFLNKQELVKLIANGLIVLLLFCSFSAWGNQRFQSESYQELFKLFKMLHVTKKPWIEPIFKKHFDLAYKRSELVQKCLSVLICFAITSFLAGGCLLDYVIADSEYPLPSFYQMSFLPVTNRITYALNFAQQTIFASSAILNFQSIGAIVFHTSFLVIAKFDSTIAVINCFDKTRSEITFEEWLKEVTEAFRDVRRVLKLLRETQKVFFYILEKLAFYVVLSVWIFFHIDIKMIGIAFSGLSVLLAVSVVVWVNETFLDRFEEVNFALYNLPWYEMSPYQRKQLMLQLQLSLIPISLSSGGITDWTLEWYGNVVKGGYSAGLFLQDLITLE